MKINFSPVNFLYNYQNALPKNRPQTLAMCAPLALLNRDTVSFSGTAGKKPLSKEIEQLGEENIPEPILKKAKELLAQDEESIALSEIHQEYYAALEDCETLEDAKLRYPEFNEVKQVGECKFRSNSNGAAIQRGEITGLTSENATLMFLKKLYCDAKFDGPEYDFKNDYFNLSKNGYFLLRNELGIPGFRKPYMTYLQSKRQWQDPEWAKRSTELFAQTRQDPEFIRKQREGSRKNMIAQMEDPDYVAKQRAGLSRAHRENEAYIAKRDASIILARLVLNIPENRAKQIAAVQAANRKSEEVLAQEEADRLERIATNSVIRGEALSRTMNKVWDEMPPEVSDIFSEVFQEFPGLRVIFRKRDKNEGLSESDAKCLNAYYKRVNERCRERGYDVGKLQSAGMKKYYSGFYKAAKAEYLKAKAADTLDELLARWAEARKTEK